MSIGIVVAANRGKSRVLLNLMWENTVMLRRLLLSVLVAALPLGWAQSSGNSFRFSIIGDRTGTAVRGVYEQTWREVERLKPDFVINVGDTIQGKNDKTAEAEWKQIRAILNLHKRVPFFMVPGNHDVWDEFSENLWKRETGRPTSYSFDYQNAHFVVLDNSRTTRLSDTQLKFLEDDLKANQQRRPKFVFFHQPYWLVYLKLGTGAFPLHRLARQYGVDLVVSGHGHTFQRVTRDEVTYIEIGSSGAKVTSKFGLGSFYQHALVTVRGWRFNVMVKELDQPHGKGRSFNAQDWNGDETPLLPAPPPAKRSKASKL
jgi:predicted phosphodiesterase